MDKTDVLTDKITKNIWSGQIKRSKGVKVWRQSFVWLIWIEIHNVRNLNCYIVSKSFYCP